MSMSTSLRKRPRCTSRALIASPWLSDECCSKLMYFAIFSRKVTASSRKAWSIFVVAAKPSSASIFTALVAVAVSVICLCAHSRCSMSFSCTKASSCLDTSYFACKSPKSASNRAASCSKSPRWRSISARVSVRRAAMLSTRSFSTVPKRARATRVNSSKRSFITSKVCSVMRRFSSTFSWMALSFCKMTSLVSAKRASVNSKSSLTLASAWSITSCRAFASSSLTAAMPSWWRASSLSRSAWLCSLCSSSISHTDLWSAACFTFASTIFASKDASVSVTLWWISFISFVTRLSKAAFAFSHASTSTFTSSKRVSSAKCSSSSPCCRASSARKASAAASRALSRPSTASKRWSVCSLNAAMTLVCSSWWALSASSVAKPCCLTTSKSAKMLWSFSWSSCTFPWSSFTAMSCDARISRRVTSRFMRASSCVARRRLSNSSIRRPSLSMPRSSLKFASSRYSTRSPAGRHVAPVPPGAALALAAAAALASAGVAAASGGACGRRRPSCTSTDGMAVLTTVLRKVIRPTSLRMGTLLCASRPVTVKLPSSAESLALATPCLPQSSLRPRCW
mmetsp:Transcript_22367/g.64136  ORF Transcript_22367/g.64136 Transcript_22367/m.64136 type:complete len:568 (-) Transcript_22367:225-1928(-)